MPLRSARSTPTAECDADSGARLGGCGGTRPAASASRAATAACLAEHRRWPAPVRPDRHRAARALRSRWRKAPGAARSPARWCQWQAVQGSRPRPPHPAGSGSGGRGDEGPRREVPGERQRCRRSVPAPRPGAGQRDQRHAARYWGQRSLARRPLPCAGLGSPRLLGSYAARGRCRAEQGVLRCAARHAWWWIAAARPARWLAARGSGYRRRRRPSPAAGSDLAERQAV